jgi:hypothetical protein
MDVANGENKLHARRRVGMEVVLLAQRPMASVNVALPAVRATLPSPINASCTAVTTTSAHAVASTITGWLKPDSHLFF